MADIVHQLKIDAAQDKIFDAVATVEGLKGWWTEHVEGESVEGETLSFNFPNEGPVMEVLEVSPDFVKWKCTSGPNEWLNTIITFDLEEKKGSTEVLFAQSGWLEDSAFFAHCNMKWAVFLLSLKEYCETGTGRAFPNDISIGDKEISKAVV